MTKTIAVIVDFDNYFNHDISALSPELLEYTFSTIVNLCQANFTEFNKIDIRLYGGWYQEYKLTKQASTLQQLLAYVNVFPKVNGTNIIHGTIEMISSLLIIPDHIWGHTYKETDGIPRIRINHELVDDVCNSNRELCPKFIIYKFTNNKDKNCAVDKCSILHKNVFKGVQQKMVDTIIACDILSFSEEENIRGIILLSDDQDHFPSLALAAKKQQLKKETSLEAIILGIQNIRKLDFISEYLKPFNIQTMVLK